MAIGDTVDETDGWPRHRVAAIDDELIREGLPSLSAVRLQFSELIHRVVNRGSIQNDVEYHAVRNVVERTQEGQEPLWKLVSAYEERHAG
jgi:hypothetical protein